MLPKIHGDNRCSVFPDDNFGYYEPIQNLRYVFQPFTTISTGTEFVLPCLPPGRA
jgi:hypothetical protein